jgi:HSP20 family molecular chaperone IbpA
MWSHAWGLLEQADRLHRQFFHPSRGGREQATWEPPVDVFEDERELIVVVAMPGVPSARVEVRTEPGALVIRGVRPLPFIGRSHVIRHLEIPYGIFERRVALPPGRFEVGAPELADGCLLVHLKKRP